MPTRNFLGTEGYFTAEQRKMILQQGMEYFTIETNIELSAPIRVIPYGSQTEFTIDQYSRDIASFFAFWGTMVAGHLNGFSGMYHLKFELVGFTLKTAAPSKEQLESRLDAIDARLKELNGLIKSAKAIKDNNTLSTLLFEQTTLKAEHSQIMVQI